MAILFGVLAAAALCIKYDQLKLIDEISNLLLNLFMHFEPYTMRPKTSVMHVPQHNPTNAYCI